MVARSKLVLSGSMGASQVEQWSTGINFGPGAGGDLPETPAELQGWANTVHQLLAGPDAPVNLLLAGDDSVTVDRVTCYWYPGPGPAAAVGASTEAPVDFAGGSVSLPPQVSVVLSLLTGFPGGSYRGRLYWPATACTLGSNYNLTGPTAASLASSAAQFLDDAGITQQTATNLQASVYSPTLDVMTPVIGVSVGNVLDTQRRRRDGLIESRSYSEIP